MVEVVQLHDGRPPLNDIPGRLRLLADNIEAGHNGDVGALYVIMPRDGEFPTVLGYGAADDVASAVMQLELAKHWFMKNAVR